MSSLKREPVEFEDDDDDDMMDDDEEDDGAMDATMSVTSMADEISDLSIKVESDSAPVESEPRPPVRSVPQGQPSGRSSRRKPAAPQWVNPEWQEVVDVAGVGIRGVGSGEEKREVIINGVCVMQTDAPFGSAGAGVGVGSRVSPRTAIEDEEEEEEDEEEERGGGDHRTVEDGTEMGSRHDEDEPMEEGEGEEGLSSRDVGDARDEQLNEGVGEVEEEDCAVAESPRLPCKSEEGAGEEEKGVESEGDAMGPTREDRSSAMMSDIACADERLGCGDSGAGRSADCRDDEDEAAMDESLEKLQKRMKREEEEEEEDWEF